MTNDEKQLLENVLDALDRLFDRESSVVDLQALIFATSKALAKAEYDTALREAASGLDELLRMRLSTNDEREKALEATNDLRILLAKVLDF